MNICKMAEKQDAFKIDFHGALRLWSDGLWWWVHVQWASAFDCHERSSVSNHKWFCNHRHVNHACSDQHSATKFRHDRCRQILG